MLPHGHGVPPADDLLDLLQGDTQELELADDEEGQQLVLGVVAVVALVLPVVRHQKTDGIVVPQGLDGDVAEG